MPPGYSLQLSNSKTEIKPITENAEISSETRTAKPWATIEKAVAQFNTFLNRRKAKLGKLISKRHCIEPVPIDYINIKEVQQLKSAFDALVSEFTTSHYSTQELLCLRRKNRVTIMTGKLCCFKDFQDAVKKWLI